MAFLTVYEGIASRLRGMALAESLSAVDFKNAPATEYGNTFILKCLTGEQPLETVDDRFYDQQEWQVQVAFAKNELSDIIQLKEAHIKKDEILADLDDPTSWTSFVKMLKYKSWELVETPNYYVLDVRLQVLDTYIYA